MSQRRYFDQIAFGYDEYRSRRRILRHHIACITEEIVDATALAGQVILEIGVGAGTYARHFLSTTEYVFGLEISPVMATVASKKGIQVAIGDAHALPFATESFETVILIDTLHHLHDPVAALTEAGRVVRRHLVIVEPSFTNPWTWFYHTFHPRERVYRQSTVAVFLRQAGLTLRETVGTNYLPTVLPDWAFIPALHVERSIAKVAPGMAATKLYFASK